MSNTLNKLNTHRGQFLLSSFLFMRYIYLILYAILILSIKVKGGNSMPQTDEEKNRGKVFEREVLDRLIKIEMKLDGVENVKKVSYDNQKDILTMARDFKELDRRVSEIEDNSKWLWRAVGSAIIIAIIGIIVIYIKIGMGIN